MVTALGVDVGSTNTKVVLAEVTDDAAVVERSVASAPTPPDPRGLLAVVVRLAREVLAGSAEPPAAIGVASMAETGVPLADDGAPLTDLLRWDGHRAGAQADALARDLGREVLFAATGVRPSAKVPLATLAWLRDVHPDTHRAVARWAGVADLVTLALTGELVTDHTLAGRTMAYRLPADGALPGPSFDGDLLAAVGLRPEHLPRVASPLETAGRLDPGGTAATWGGAAQALVAAGVAAGTPVVVAGHDHAVGTWAAGVRRPGERADSLGTAEAVLTVLGARPEPAAVQRAGMSHVRTVDGRHDALLAGSSSAGAMLGWLRDRLRVESLDEHLDAALAAARADGRPSGVVVLPYVAGRQSPHPDPSARVRVEPEVDGVLLTRAVLEGVCLQARWMLDTQAALGATAPDGPLTVLGAALAVPAWAWTKRHTTPGAIRSVSATEPVATGAALLALVRSGALGDVATLLRDAPVLPGVQAPPTDVGTFDAAYRAFVDAATR